MRLNKIHSLAFSLMGSLFVSSGAHSQNFNQEFERQLFIQKYEQLADDINNKFDLGMNIAVLDIASAADLNFVGSIALLKSGYHYFIASAYNDNSTLGGANRPGCVIFINYKNKASFSTPTALDAKYGRERTTKFFDYLFISHETGHCLAQRTIKGPTGTQEKYADSIATYFIRQSEFRDMIPDWIETLKYQKPPHNTYSYVSRFYEQTQEINSLPEILKRIR